MNLQLFDQHGFQGVDLIRFLVIFVHVWSGHFLFSLSFVSNRILFTCYGLPFNRLNISLYLLVNYFYLLFIYLKGLYYLIFIQHLFSSFFFTSYISLYCIFHLHLFFHFLFVFFFSRVASSRIIFLVDNSHLMFT